MAAAYRHPTPATTKRPGRRLRRALTTAIACMALVWPAAALGGESVQFNLTGRGWGHGVGMSQWGAYGYAKHGWTYRQILSHYYTGIKFATVANRPIRVLLNERQKSVKISSETPCKAVWGSRRLAIPGGATATVTWASGAFKLAVAGKTYSSPTAITFVPGKSRLRLANSNMSSLPSANARYRGSLRVLRQPAGLSIVNLLPLEDYLCGVVPREVSASWPAEALKAQAVAARSFGAARLGSAGHFDVYCDTRSQAYNGADGEAVSTNAAVRATRGIVPIHGGKPITAFFFSSSGGHTEDAENVWGGRLPYLRGVTDPYDTYSPLHVWPDNPISKSGTAVQSALGGYAPAGTLQTIYVTKRGSSPRVVTAHAVGTKGVTVLSGAVLRARLGLRSAWFTVRTLSVAPAATPLTTITFGQPFALTGRTFPLLSSNDAVVLHYRQGNGSWRSRKLESASVSEGSLTLSSGIKARYSAYTAAVSPAGRSSYYFSVGAARSPQTTIAVRPAVSLELSSDVQAPGRQLALTANVRPVVLAGTEVTLQQQTANGWAAAARATLDANGQATLNWTPAAAGTYKLRLRVPAAHGLAAGVSAVAEVTVPAGPSPSLSPPQARISFPRPV